MTNHKIIVLDDDPTGTQTVQNVVVLTVWDLKTLTAEMLSPAPLFFILTNTRAMSAPEASALNRVVCKNLAIIQEKYQLSFTLISRSDSTLRGHFPMELEAIEKGLKQDFDAWFLIPFFEEGGRVTLDDVHYLKENGQFTPVGETPFAKDATFGYKNSNLKAWVEEKTKGKVKKEAVISISLAELRNTESALLLEKLNLLKNKQIVIVNAEKYEDLLPLANALQKLPHKKFLFRTAASWVKAVKSLSSTDENNALRPIAWQKKNETGGLILVGSYVPKTTEQLGILIENNPEFIKIEVLVEELLSEQRQQYLEELASEINTGLEKNRNVLVFTSRNLVKDTNPIRSLEIGNQVSTGLVYLVQNLKVKPSFLIAKGGITSSDIATRGLGIRRAIVKGQVLAGVPVWQVEGGLFPNLLYVVFPGNVGDKYALSKVYQSIIS